MVLPLFLVAQTSLVEPVVYIRPDPCGEIAAELFADHSGDDSLLKSLHYRDLVLRQNTCTLRSFGAPHVIPFAVWCRIILVFSVWKVAYPLCNIARVTAVCWPPSDPSRLDVLRSAVCWAPRHR